MLIIKQSVHSIFWSKGSRLSIKLCLFVWTYCVYVWEKDTTREIHVSIRIKHQQHIYYHWPCYLSICWSSSYMAYSSTYSESINMSWNQLIIMTLHVQSCNNQRYSGYFYLGPCSYLTIPSTCTSITLDQKFWWLPSSHKTARRYHNKQIIKP